MVLIKHENTPSIMWPLDRIVELYPGADTTV